MAVNTPETRWVVFRGGQPLVTNAGASGARSFTLLRTAHVIRLLGEEPFFGQGQAPGEAVSSDVPLLEACRVRGAPAVFLGLKEPVGTQALPSSEFNTPEEPEDIGGAPYFSIDVTHISSSDTEAFLRNSSQDGEILEFIEPRTATLSFNAFEAAVFAESRSMLDWNTRNKFCAACGSPTYSLWGGWKLSCSSLLPWNDKKDEKPCPSGTGLQNFAHPRTDPVVIVAVIDDTGDRILLGRNKKFPGNMYSILAGFCEPAESFEDAAKREIWEESGVRVHDVHYHSSQPWPYPANLMVGCYAFADSSQTIRTDLDNELDDARWFTRDEVVAVLNYAERKNQRRSEYQFDEVKPSPQAQGESEEKASPPFGVPPRRTIAGVMISDWATGKYRGSPIIKGGL